MSSSVDADELQTPLINNRRWIDSSSNHCTHDDDDCIAATGAAAKFRLATYNILSDDAIKPGEYLYCPSQLRYMASRHERIINEIRNMQPHVVCFQVQLLLSVSLSLSMYVCVAWSAYMQWRIQKSFREGANEAQVRTAEVRRGYWLGAPSPSRQLGSLGSAVRSLSGVRNGDQETERVFCNLSS